MTTETLNESPAVVERVHAGRLLEDGHAHYNHNPQDRGNANEAHLLSALAEYEHSIGKTLKVSYGEYAYLGDNGKEGARLAFLPKEGSLDQIGQYVTADHLRAHLEREIPLQKDREAVSAFFMFSEIDSIQSKKRTQDEEQPEIVDRQLTETDAERLNKHADENNTIQPTPDQETKLASALAEPQENAFVRFSSADDVTAQPAAAVSQKNAPQQAKDSLATLLNGRFIRGENGEYRRLMETRVALMDEANKIRFVDKQMDTFQAAIELANSKDWKAILVTGTEKFRREAWYQARLAGLKVVGYEPTEKDLKTFATAQEHRHNKDVPDRASDVSKHLKSESLADAEQYALKSGGGTQSPNIANGRYAGKMIHETEHHMVQDVGRKIAVVHDKSCFDSVNLEKMMARDASLRVQYDKGRGILGAGQERSHAKTY